jgi:hypothetical protein
MHSHSYAIQVLHKPANCIPSDISTMSSLSIGTLNGKSSFSAGLPLLKNSFQGTSVAFSAEFDKALGVIDVEPLSAFGGEAVPVLFSCSSVSSSSSSSPFGRSELSQASIFASSISTNISVRASANSRLFVAHKVGVSLRTCDALRSADAASQLDIIAKFPSLTLHKGTR